MQQKRANKVDGSQLLRPKAEVSIVTFFMPTYREQPEVVTKITRPDCLGFGGQRMPVKRYVEAHPEFVDSRPIVERLAKAFHHKELLGYENGLSKIAKMNIAEASELYLVKFSESYRVCYLFSSPRSGAGGYVDISAFVANSKVSSGSFVLGKSGVVNSILYQGATIKNSIILNSHVEHNSSINDSVLQTTFVLPTTIFFNSSFDNSLIGEAMFFNVKSPKEGIYYVSGNEEPMNDLYMGEIKSGSMQSALRSPNVGGIRAEIDAGLDTPASISQNKIQLAASNEQLRHPSISEMLPVGQGKGQPIQLDLSVHQPKEKHPSRRETHKLLVKKSIDETTKKREAARKLTSSFQLFYLPGQENVETSKRERDSQPTEQEIKIAEATNLF